MQAADVMDVAKRKHGGNAASNAAYKRVAPSAASFRLAIWHYLRRFPLGLTCKEIAAHFKAPMHSVSGRLSEMKRDARVIATGDRRDGGSIVVVLNPSRDLFAGVPSTEGGA